MRKGNLTREQAVAIVGESMVSEADADSCDFTNRLLDGCDDAVEFSGSACGSDLNGNDATVIVYYYPTQRELDDAGDDLGSVNWVIEGYEII